MRICLQTYICMYVDVYIYGAMQAHEDTRAGCAVSPLLLFSPCLVTGSLKKPADCFMARLAGQPALTGSACLYPMLLGFQTQVLMAV